MKELTLFNLADLKYGIWRDKFQAIKEVKSIHWLPPDPGFISGMSAIEGRTIALFDLCACLGLPAIDRKKEIYSVLLCEYEGKHAAFMVDFVIGNHSIPLEAVFSMPDYLRTEVVDTCAVHASEPTPVINISSLFKNVLEQNFKPLAPEFHILGTQTNDLSSVKTVRVFTSGDEFFAIPATCVEKKSLMAGTVCKMAMLPDYVNGITVQKGKILPQIHLSRRLKLPEDGTGEMMLVADIGGQGFGLLVDSDIGQWGSKNFIVKPLPELVQSNWQKNAVILADKIIPIVEPEQLLTEQLLTGQLLTDQADVFEDTPLPQRYNPDSGFKDFFSKNEVEVLEFFLLGVRHAIPKSEVEDHISLKPYRKLPDTISIVAGVAEHDGELLPVLDLAVCFDRQSVVTPQWRMILVKNGDFKALVLTEAVLDERLLPVKIQYSLPFGDSMSLVYGCYTDDAEARLILNVQALAVNFDETRFKKFFGAFAITEKTEPVKTEPAKAEPVISGPDVSDETMEKIKPVIDKVVDEEISPPNEPDDFIEPIELQEPDEPDSSDDLETLTEAYDLPPENKPVEEPNEEIDEEIDFTFDNLEEAPEEEVAIEQEEIPEDEAIDELYIIDTEDTLNEELEIDTEITDSEIENQNPDGDELFDKLSDAFDSSEDLLPEAIKKDEDEDKELFDKLNKAFDSSVDQTTDHESEELQDVIEEILFNEKDEDRDEPSVVQLEQEMEVLPNEPEDVTSYIDLDEPIDDLESPENASSKPETDPEYIAPVTETEPETAVDNEPVDEGTEEEKPKEDETDNPGVAIEPEMLSDIISEEIKSQEIESESISETDQAAEEKNEGEEEIVGLSELSAPERPDTAWISKTFMTIEESIKEQEVEAEKDAKTKEEAEQYFSDYYNLKTPAQKKLKKRIVYATLAIFLLFGLILIYFSGGDKNFSNRYKKEKVAPPAVAEQHKPDLVHSTRPLVSEKLATEKTLIIPPAITSKSVETKKKKPVKVVIPASHEPVILKPAIPRKVAQRPPATTELTTYTVKKGDTLWSISKHHTGSGFNFPGMAVNNAIKNPDLIFPEQEIKISK